MHQDPPGGWKQLSLGYSWSQQPLTWAIRHLGKFAEDALLLTLCRVLGKKEQGDETERRAKHQIPQMVVQPADIFHSGKRGKLSCSTVFWLVFQLIVGNQLPQYLVCRDGLSPDSVLANS